ncbi:MAG: TlyA family RNA methyltransferase [Dermatophilaceae bacterium]
MSGASEQPGRGETTRLDQALVRRGLARSRVQARDLVRAARVHVDGIPATKAAAPVAAGADLHVEGPVDPWVGRGAVKLRGALEAFEIAVAGRRCLDVGASTGGFTQVLLQAGAESVLALDVGHGQLALVLAADPRVTDRPGTDIRAVDAQALGRFDVVVADVSFISLTLVLGRVADLLAPSADLVVLVKPQFEVGRGKVGKGGVVRAWADRHDALVAVCRTLEDVGIGIFGMTPSPVRGASGNREYLVWGSTRDDGRLGWPQVLARAEQMEASE